MESIRHKVVRSSFWSLGGNWLSRVLGLIKLIILARLLSPIDFGIIGLAILSVNVLNVFSETGVEAALIQKDKIGRTELDIAWTLGIVRGLLLFTLLFLSAGLIASYFDNMTLKPVLRAMSATFLLGGFTNIGIIYFQKELDFKKKVILDSIADISGAVSAVFLAFYIRNVWALVAGTIVWVMVKCLASYSLHPYRPKIRWDWPVAKNLLNYGKHIFWISVVTFIVTSGDDALVGKLLGLTTLGFYTMAYNIANVPVSSLTGIIGRISFPAYSIMQKNPERLKEAFRKIFETVLIILLPFTVLIILLARDFTSIFLGDKWLPIVPVLQILCLLGLFRGLANIFSPIQLAVNRPAIQSRNKTLELILFLALLYPFTTKWGLIGAAWAVTLVYFTSAIVNALSSASLMSPFLRILLKASWTPLLATFGLMLSTWMVQSCLKTMGGLFQFMIAGISGFVVFGLIILTLRKNLLRDIWTGA
jgi:O-antigen/teichoic acid export membrane protein